MIIINQVLLVVIILLFLTPKIKTIMASMQELLDKVNELQVSIDAEQEQVASAIANLEAVVADLTAQLADGGTAAQRQEALDKLTSAIEDIKSTIPDAPSA